MALIGKDTILQADDIVFEDVAVPEWGGDVRVAVMTGTDRDSWELSMMSVDKSGKTSFSFGDSLRVNLLARCIIGEDGKRIFTSKADLVALGQKSGKVLDRLFAVAQRINGITEDEMEELEKNSEAVLNGNSGSD